MAGEIRLALIWHMHQPDYRDPESGVHLLPWVRLHSVKGYRDVAKISEDWPNFRQTINFSPVLLSQITDLAENPERDHFFELSRKPTEDLTESEKDFLLRHCFLINWDIHVRPYQRFNQLLMKRGIYVDKIDLEYVQGRFTKGDFRDLIVLFNLAWCGFTISKDPFLERLKTKGQGFTEEEKLVLLEKHREAIEQVIPFHKKLFMDGKIEITCTPENHPILPLLIDLRVRSDKYPDAPVFRHPEDARRQLTRGIEIFERVFERKPTGMWPSEGSISQEAVELIQQMGISWIAADEALLTDPSTGTVVPPNPDNRFPWLIAKPDGPPLYCCFRNRGLSDDIGFNYAKKAPEEAVKEFIGNLENIAKSAPKSGPPPLITLVCDGENPWEYYPDGGEGFLTGIAKALDNHPLIKTTTPSEYLREFQPSGRVAKIGAGSWIGGNFDIWLGCKEDRKAWKILADVREKLDEVFPLPEGSADEIGTEEREKILEQIWVAEGSDWFWWYGEPYDSPLDYMFDLIFRRRIRRAYEIMGLESPSELLYPIDPKLPVDNLNVKAPLDIISPDIDGRITTFYEWSGAGHLKSCMLEGLVARAESGPVTDIYFDADLVNLFIRLDIDWEKILPADVLVVRFIKPNEITLAVDLNRNVPVRVRLYRPDPKDPRNHHIETIETAAVGQIVELAIPITAINALPKDTVSFTCAIMRGSFRIDSCPLIGTISMIIPDEQYYGELWLE